MQTYDPRERIAHVYRRLGVGAHPDLVAETANTDEAIARSLDLSGKQRKQARPRPPQSWDDVYDGISEYDMIPWWIDQMAKPDRLIEERLTWFWHDHFAVSMHKVDFPYLVWEHLRLLREHATGNFAELLHAVAKDAAMIRYLDGNQNTNDAINENYAREVMELHTLGVGHYTQTDVVEAARCFTGWHINETRWNDNGDELRGRFEDPKSPPWSGIFFPEDHDDGAKHLLGKSGNFDLDRALDVILEQPRTAEFVAGKLYRELVGLTPKPAMLGRIADRFRSNYDILDLVGAIAEDPTFVSDEAIRTKVRTPVEKAVSLLEAFPKNREGSKEEWRDNLVWFFERLSYMPLNPPDPAGYPKGQRLLGPGDLVTAFALTNLVEIPQDTMPVDDVLARFGLFTVSDQTRQVLDRATASGFRPVLAFGSPEFMQT